MAVFSRHDQALQWAREQASRHWGPSVFSSDVFDFNDTTYYERSMGTGLRKTFLVFQNLIDPQTLPDLKWQTNAWEQLYRDQHDCPEPRPLNLDPGYLTEAKLVLATTKDRDHRLYLSRGIFAEVTLYYHRGAWKTREWTYPDYRSADYHQFFTRCRELLARTPMNSSGNSVGA